MSFPCSSARTCSAKSESLGSFCAPLHPWTECQVARLPAATSFVAVLSDTLPIIIISGLFLIILHHLTLAQLLLSTVCRRQSSFWVRVRDSVHCATYCWVPQPVLPVCAQLHFYWQLPTHTPPGRSSDRWFPFCNCRQSIKITTATVFTRYPATIIITAGATKNPFTVEEGAYRSTSRSSRCTTFASTVA